MSQALRLWWQKLRESQRVPTSEQAETFGPQAGKHVNIPEMSSTGNVQEGGQHGASSVPKASYADIVKGVCHRNAACVEPTNVQVNDRGQSGVLHIPEVCYTNSANSGCHSGAPCTSGPSNGDSVNLEDQPDETRVCASHSQASLRNGSSRNSQFTCNSLTFLASLHEDENITRADFDLVLDKGDAMYKEARKRFPTNIHLASDELPDEVSAHRSSIMWTKHNLPVTAHLENLYQVL